jgi:hypothetical protein
MLEFFDKGRKNASIAAAVDFGVLDAKVTVKKNSIKEQNETVSLQKHFGAIC